MSSIFSLSGESTTSTQQQAPSISTDLSDDPYDDSLPWILYRIFQCEIPEELSLRAMFSFNSGAKGPFLQQLQSFWVHQEKGQKLLKFFECLPSINKDAVVRGATSDRSYRHSGDRFMDPNNEDLLDIDITSELSDARPKPQGLPIDFVEQFCLDVFCAEREEVDFHHALTAIDYLRDFENTRCQILRAAAERIGITKDNWRDVLKAYPEVETWVESVQDVELHLEECYASLFVDLRLWTMVNELQATPFYRPNALAMLNTLFPPSIRYLPNHLVSLKMMYRHRSILYSYLVAVQFKGVSALEPYINAIQPGCSHSWESVRECLESYFAKSKFIMKAAQETEGITYLRPRDSSSGETQTSTDYTTSERPLTGSSAASSVEQAVPSPHHKATLTEEGVIWRMSYQAPTQQTSTEPNLISSFRVCNGQAKIPRPDSTNIKTTTVDSAPKESTVDIQKPPGAKQDQAPNTVLNTAIKSTPATPALQDPNEVLTDLAGLGIDVHDYANPDASKVPYSKRTTVFELGPELESPTWEGRYVTELIPTPEATSLRLAKTPTTELRGYGKFPNTAFHFFTPGSGKRLPSDNFDFLNHPYEDPNSPSLPVLKKKSSFKNLFQKKNSSTTLHKNYSTDNALGIKLSGRSQTPEGSRLAKHNSHGSERPTPMPRKRSALFRPFTPRPDTDESHPRKVHKAQSFGDLFRRHKQQEEDSEEESEEEEVVHIPLPLPDPNQPCNCCPDRGKAFRAGKYPSISIRPSETIPRPKTCSWADDPMAFTKDPALQPSIRHATSAPNLSLFSFPQAWSPQSNDTRASESPSPEPFVKPSVPLATQQSPVKPPTAEEQKPAAQPSPVSPSTTGEQKPASPTLSPIRPSTSREQKSATPPLSPIRPSTSGEHKQVTFSTLPPQYDTDPRPYMARPLPVPPQSKGKSLTEMSSHTPVLNSKEFIDNEENGATKDHPEGVKDMDEQPVLPSLEQKVIKKKKSFNFWKKEKPAPVKRAPTPILHRPAGILRRTYTEGPPPPPMPINPVIIASRTTPITRISLEYQQKRKAERDAKNQQYVRKDEPLVTYQAKQKVREAAEAEQTKREAELAAREKRDWEIGFAAIKEVERPIQQQTVAQHRQAKLDAHTAANEQQARKEAHLAAQQRQLEEETHLALQKQLANDKTIAEAQAQAQAYAAAEKERARKEALIAAQLRKTEEEAYMALQEKLAKVTDIEVATARARARAQAQAAAEEKRARQEAQFLSQQRGAQGEAHTTQQQRLADQDAPAAAERRRARWEPRLSAERQSRLYAPFGEEKRQATVPFTMPETRSYDRFHGHNRHIESDSSFRQYRPSHDHAGQESANAYSDGTPDMTHGRVQRQGEGINNDRGPPPLNRQETFPMTTESQRRQRNENQGSNNIFRRPQAPINRQGIYRFATDTQTHGRFESRGRSYTVNPHFVFAEPQGAESSGKNVDPEQFGHSNKPSLESNTSPQDNQIQVPSERQTGFPFPDMTAQPPPNPVVDQGEGNNMVRRTHTRFDIERQAIDTASHIVDKREYNQPNKRGEASNASRVNDELSRTTRPPFPKNDLYPFGRSGGQSGGAVSSMRERFERQAERPAQTQPDRRAERSNSNQAAHIRPCPPMQLHGYPILQDMKPQREERGSSSQSTQQ